MRLFCLIALLGLQASKASQWGYSGKYGPENWPGICMTGKKQSPIDIVTEDAIRVDLGALKFHRYDFAFPSTMINTGHSVQILFHGVPLHLSGGSLSSMFVLEQMHFHWSAEHTVDGLRDPLELHLVHYDIKYTNFSVALQHKYGIAVVAVLFELSSDDNPDLSPIVDATKLVSNWVGHNMIHVRNKLIPLLFLPKDHTTYYNYEGSLTTPACQEDVLWFVMTEKLKVSETQMDVFRQMDGSNGTLKFNYRPIQKLGDRRVYHRLEGYINTSSNITWSVSTVLIILLVRFLV
ncbi:PREDICTED: carbonic anhydrase 2-like isoform X1 [Trachymyrmex septentrionalis]|uniref:carbonic anhydrase 2-like isoform X1 n=1 Tax=Trachymyrmex septentrionalis TaxID=34720 RepID=UPI00084EF516|nr:PREDICTED: carbonic anhydrase 2-like isoform X1 [Trachymyrmex septentrionalis]